MNSAAYHRLTRAGAASAPFCSLSEEKKQQVIALGDRDGRPKTANIVPLTVDWIFVSVKGIAQDDGGYCDYDRLRRYRSILVMGGARGNLYSRNN